MMKRILMAFAALVLLGSIPAMAAPVPFNVTITIRQAISITKLTDLDFGTVETVSSPTTYTVLPASAPGSGAGTAATAASFTIQGEATQVANVSFTANPVTVTCSAPCAGSLSVNLTPEATTHTFSGAAETFYVGGDVQVISTTQAGVYTGTANLSLVYQ
ncbi:MAG TPA: DUF4402 domain-containing protein [bacterium]|nr:DUF4402 domain-containing protein [bacterium]